MRICCETTETCGLGTLGARHATRLRGFPRWGAAAAGWRIGGCGDGRSPHSRQRCGGPHCADESAAGRAASPAPAAGASPRGFRCATAPGPLPCRISAPARPAYGHESGERASPVPPPGRVLPIQHPFPAGSAPGRSGGTRRRRPSGIKTDGAGARIFIQSNDLQRLGVRSGPGRPAFPPKACGPDGANICVNVIRPGASDLTALDAQAIVNARLESVCARCCVAGARILPRTPSEPSPC